MVTIIALAFPFTLVFMAYSDQLTWQGFVVGYVLSLGALWLGQAYRLNLKPRRIFSQIMWLLWYTLRLAVDIFISSLQVARMVLSPNINAQIDPAVVKVDTGDDTNNEIVTAMCSHGITITPGQMVVDIRREDNKTVLYVHNLNMGLSGDLQQEQAQRLRLIRKVLGYE